MEPNQVLLPAGTRLDIVVTFSVTDCDHVLNWKYSYTLKYAAWRKSTTDIVFALFHSKMEGTPLHAIVDFKTYDLEIVEPDEAGDECDCHNCVNYRNRKHSSN